MTGIIWYDNKTEYGRKKAFERFEQLIEDYSKRNIMITKTKKSYFFAFVQFENGDYWRVFSTNENNRGAACNVSLIESDIPKEIIDTIIKPCTKALPYRAFNFYYSDLGVDIT